MSNKQTKRVAMRYESDEVVSFVWGGQSYEADVTIEYHEDEDTPCNIEGWTLQQLYNTTRKRLIWNAYLNENDGLKKALEDAIAEHEPVREVNEECLD